MSMCYSDRLFKILSYKKGDGCHLVKGTNKLQSMVSVRVRYCSGLHVCEEIEKVREK